MADDDLSRTLAWFAAAADGADLDGESRCAGWSIGAVVSHVIEVTDRFSRFAAGDDGLVTSSSLDGAIERSAAAWRAADVSRSCRLSFGTFDAPTAAGINAFDALVHTWDVDPTFRPDDDELVLRATAIAGRLVHQDRHYAPPPDTAAATPFERLLVLTGRDPR